MTPRGGESLTPTDGTEIKVVSLWSNLQVKPNS